MNIVFLDAATLTLDGLSLSPFEKLGNFVSYESTSPDQIIERAKDAEIVITNKVILDANILSNLSKLKYICVAATGYNCIDIQATKVKQIPVSNVSGYSTNSVAQMVFAHILHANHHISYYDEAVFDGRWQQSNTFSFYDHTITELKGKTLGIFGLGTIGQKVSEIGKAFGMKVIATSRSEKNVIGVKMVSFDTLYQESDFLTIHASLNKTNEGIFNREVFERMKSAAILINTGRGGFIDEGALAKALESDQIRYACLDVLSSEPPLDSNPLIGAKNCIITPHQAWTSKEARQTLVNKLVDNIRAYQNEEPLKNLVNTNSV